MSMGDMSIQISRTEISSFASARRLFSATDGADVNGTQRRLFDPRERVFASRTAFVRRSFRAIEAKHVLARNQASVDQNGQIAFFACVNRGVGNFFRRQVHLVK